MVYYRRRGIAITSVFIFVILCGCLSPQMHEGDSCGNSICEIGENVLECKTDCAVRDSLFNFVVYGDSRTNMTQHSITVDLIKRLEPEFVVHTGDLVSSGDHMVEWTTFFDTISKLENIPFYPCLGNHEYINDENASNYHEFFDLPGNEKWYSFDWEHLHFIILDSTSLETIDEQLPWLEKDLENTENKFIFVVFHYPFYYSSKHHSKDYELKFAEDLRQRLEPLFLEYGVDMVFNGHLHVYERAQVQGIHYFVTGGGGGPIYMGGQRITPQWSKSYHEKFHILNFFVFEDKLVFQAIDSKGILLDSGTIS